MTIRNTPAVDIPSDVMLTILAKIDTCPRQSASLACVSRDLRERYQTQREADLWHPLRSMLGRFKEPPGLEAPAFERRCYQYCASHKHEFSPQWVNYRARALTPAPKVASTTTTSPGIGALLRGMSPHERGLTQALLSISFAEHPWVQHLSQLLDKVDQQIDQNHVPEAAQTLRWLSFILQRAPFWNCYSLRNRAVTVH